jgi:hypothetical protein
MGVRSLSVTAIAWWQLLGVVTHQGPPDSPLSTRDGQRHFRVFDPFVFIQFMEHVVPQQYSREKPWVHLATPTWGAFLYSTWADCSNIWEFQCCYMGSQGWTGQVHMGFSLQGMMTLVKVCSMFYMVWWNHTEAPKTDRHISLIQAPSIQLCCNPNSPAYSAGAS